MKPADTRQVIADPHIALAQVEAALPCQPHGPFARPMDELGIGREHHVLGLLCNRQDSYVACENAEALRPRRGFDAYIEETDGAPDRWW